MDTGGDHDIHLRMEHKKLVQHGNILQLVCTVTNYNTPYAVKTSGEFVINGVAVFELRVFASQLSNGHSNSYFNIIFLRFFKLRSEETDLTYKIKFNCKEFNIIDKEFTSDDGTWHLIHEYRRQQYSFDVSVVMEVQSNVNSFAPLYEDDELTDFELRGEGGVIRIHKVVLAAASPVFRRMLSGAWKEAREGHVDVPGTSVATLQSLKDYVYVRTLPSTGVQSLLLLASCYLMPDLEQKCVDRLVDTLSADNVVDLLEFAAKNKVTRLLLGVLEAVQAGRVKVQDIRGHVQRAV